MEKVLRVGDVLPLVGNIHRSTLRRWTNDPAVAFPRPVRLGRGTTGWLERDVTAWLEARASARDAEAVAVKVARAEAGLVETGR